MIRNARLTPGKPSEHLTLRVSRGLQKAIDATAPPGKRAGWMRVALIDALERAGIDVAEIRAAEDSRK